MPINLEAIQAVVDKTRGVEAGRPAVSNIRWKHLSPPQAYLVVSMLDFVDDETKAQTSGDRPAAFRIQSARTKLPTIVALSKKSEEFPSRYGLASGGEIRNNIQEYRKVIREAFNAREYLRGHGAVRLCDGYLYGLLGNMVTGPLRQLWTESFQSNDASGLVVGWTRHNLEAGRIFVS